MESVALIIGIGTGFVSLTTAAIGVAAFLRASGRKEYASQRDMEHLKNNQKQLSMNVEQLWRQDEERFDRIDRQLDRLEMCLTGKVGRDPGAHQLGKQ